MYPPRATLSVSSNSKNRRAQSLGPPPSLSSLTFGNQILPFSKHTWNQIWENAAREHPQQVSSINRLRDSEHVHFPEISRPSLAPTSAIPPQLIQVLQQSGDSSQLIQSLQNSQMGSIDNAISSLEAAFQQEMRTLKGRRTSGESDAVAPPPPETADLKLARVQAFLCALQYNHTGTQFFEVRKSRPFHGLMETARLMIREALPIKCLEAVIVAALLTSSDYWDSSSAIERIPVSFKTDCEGHVYRHIVLAVHISERSQHRFGCVGLSRRANLMFRPLHYASLSALVLDFVSAYAQHSHRLLKVKIGLPLPHASSSSQQVVWDAFEERVGPDVAREIDRFARDLRSLTVDGVLSGRARAGRHSSPSPSPSDDEYDDEESPAKSGGGGSLRHRRRSTSPVRKRLPLPTASSSLLKSRSHKRL